VSDARRWARRALGPATPARGVHRRRPEGAERERLWKLATKLYSGYEEYQARATNCRIPVIVEPAKA